VILAIIYDFSIDDVIFQCVAMACLYRGDTHAAAHKRRKSIVSSVGGIVGGEKPLSRDSTVRDNK
jgi:hypothetical protein